MKTDCQTSNGNEEQSKFYQLYDGIFAIIDQLPKNFIKIFISMISNGGDINALASFFNSFLLSEKIKVTTKVYAMLKNIGVEIDEKNVIIGNRRRCLTYIYENTANNRIAGKFNRCIDKITSIWGSVLNIIDVDTEQINRYTLYLVETDEHNRLEIIRISAEIMDRSHDDSLLIYVLCDLERKPDLFYTFIERAKKLFSKNKSVFKFHVCRTVTEEDLINQRYIYLQERVKNSALSYLSHYKNTIPRHIMAKEFFTGRCFRNFFVSDGYWIWSTQDIVLLKAHSILPRCGFFTYLLKQKNYRTPSLEESVMVRKYIKEVFVLS